MAGEEDVFLREVGDDLQQERTFAFFRKYGPIIAFAVLLVIAAVAFLEFRAGGQSAASARAASAYQTLTEDASNLGPDAAATLLLDAGADLGEPYAAFARLRAATYAVEAGDMARADTALGQVIGDGRLPDRLRDVARIRRAHLLVDDAPQSAIETLEGVGTEALEPLAREARAYAQIAEGDYAAAYDTLQTLQTPGFGISPSLAARASILLPAVDAGRRGVDLTPEASPDENFIQDLAERLVIERQNDMAGAPGISEEE